MSMKAVVFKEPFKVVVEDVNPPTLLKPNDAIIRISTTAICGSDLHMYEGRAGAKPGLIFGHENLGTVESVGDGVSDLNEGDRVVLPFNIGCGHCKNCEQGFTAFCTKVNPGYTGGVYGYAYMGNYNGGQAQYLRVPYADFNALRLPQGRQLEDDFILLSDVFPTGWHGVSLSGFQAGDTIAIFGAGPVGSMAAYSAKLRGASQIFVIDRISERLDKVRSIGAIPVNFDEVDPVKEILSQTDGIGVERGVDAVGYQAVSKGKEAPNTILDSLARIVRPTGGVGVPGLYLASDPGSPDEKARSGVINFPFGRYFAKGLKIGTGLCSVKLYNRYLKNLIISGSAKPSFIISHHISLEEAPEAYEKYDKRIEGYTKVLIHPNS